jgi:GxxExxY protein
MHELLRRTLQVLSEVAMPVVYAGATLDVGYRIDPLVEPSVIVELNSLSQIAPIHEAQLLTYLKL